MEFVGRKLKEGIALARVYIFQGNAGGIILGLHEDAVEEVIDVSVLALVSVSIVLGSFWGGGNIHHSCCS